METSSTSHETHDFLFSSSLYSVAFLFRQPVVDVCLSIKTCAAGAHRAELSMQVNHHLSRTKMHLPAFSQFYFCFVSFCPDNGTNFWLGALWWLPCINIKVLCWSCVRFQVDLSCFHLLLCANLAEWMPSCVLGPGHPFLWQCLFTWRQRPSTWIISSHWKWRSVHDDDEKEKYSNRALTSPL